MIEYLPLVLTGVGIIISVLYYSSVLRNANKSQEYNTQTRNAQFFMQAWLATQTEQNIGYLWNDVYNKSWETAEEWWEKYGPENDMESFSKWLSYITIFEMYGIMVTNGFLDIKLVDDTMSGGILMTWDLYGPIVMYIRENLGYPQFQEHQELLTNKIRNIVNLQHPDFKGSTRQ